MKDDRSERAARLEQTSQRQVYVGSGPGDRGVDMFDVRFESVEFVREPTVLPGAEHHRVTEVEDAGVDVGARRPSGRKIRRWSRGDVLSSIDGITGDATG